MSHFLWFLLSLFLQLPSFFAQSQTYIIRVQNDLKPSVFSNVENWYKSTLQTLDTSQLMKDSEELSNTQEFLHIYKTIFHGFSTTLTSQQAEQLKNQPGILAVMPDQLRQIQTTRTPIFLGLEGKNPSSLITESDSGSDAIIGIFDTGISPECRSFHDQGLPPIPTRWKGECVEGGNFKKSHCNKKLIGAKYFRAAYEASMKMKDVNISAELKSPRDTHGHGTHTASTAAGRKVSNASLLTLAAGVAIGVAPKARIAAYKICWKKGCSDADILAAFDAAVEDGVDVISLSVGGGTLPYHLDPIAIGSYGAMEKGIIVSASAGNEGPVAQSVANVAPWITTVGAGTIDRRFPADLKLENDKIITGAAIYSGQDVPYTPIVYAGHAFIREQGFSNFSGGACMPKSLDSDLVKGKIVICDRGGTSRATKGETVKIAGGIGVVVANLATTGEGLVADAHVIPGLSVTASAGKKLRAYVKLNKNPRASIVFRGTQVGVKPAPVVASFSARGPNAESIYVLKPDIIAPGVDILAAWPNEAPPTELAMDTRRTDFNILSGTSMSCPHVSGLVALLKGAHPDWSPAMVKSALMTTAYTMDTEGRPIRDEKAYNDSTIWDMGSGHVDPDKAVDPGLVYDLTSIDYLNFLCSSNYSRQDIRLIARRSLRCNKTKQRPWDLNYPAIVVAFEESEASRFEVIVRRTVTHVSENASSYTAEVISPKHVSVSVDPPRMRFTKKGEKQSYTVRISGKKMGVSAGSMLSEEGKLIWRDEHHVVNTPLVVVYQKPLF
ncbi:hypothetical protein DCAR_0102999 [Daucus carota subsp. sativus]|uniref:Uncharacterized protein n=1 Tax=Daucus carota subsp. sativus TaxID=79200 RepID=A0AAF1AKR6_DAUCS|nr:PREDICTED: subtilisin-like protease SBT1.5 [Daucus carota subsp. sativus]WOG83821.1 hypothetical protein DCAR_0102999 [Daucus carota subsp. sativus]